MSDYVFLDTNVTDPHVLGVALKNEGDSSASFVIDSGDVTISTSILTQQQAFDAVDLSEDGTLFYNKEVKKTQVVNKSSDLLLLGVESWTTGVYVLCSKNDADNYYTDYGFFQDNPDRLSASTPYLLTGINEGEYIITINDQDIFDLVISCHDRLLYIYVSQLNSDGSMSEGALNASIDLAQTQAELDLIVDTRV